MIIYLTGVFISAIILAFSEQLGHKQGQINGKNELLMWRIISVIFSLFSWGFIIVILFCAFRRE